MNPSFIINLFILIPAFGFLLSLFIPERRELLLSRVAFLTAGINLISFIVFAIWWLIQGATPCNIPDIYLYDAGPRDSFLLDFYFDHITAVFMITGSLLTFLITIYSRYYLHRELGYKRFFNTILFFYLGYSVTIFGGNFETLFIGWEFLGISSFLLIAFYRDRYLPVRNAVKVFSIYRIGDLGILLAMWASHHLWHENITFAKLNNAQLVHDHLLNHSNAGMFISLMLLLAAAAKSAQLPFSSWLPRAMEGPTPSSAIFYGSLSVHFGVFLLLRTYPFWEHQLTMRVVTGTLGLLTSLVASGIARVQSSAKTQIAYASISQIGLIFVEIALGLEVLALIHFTGNAFLRTYQLLVSPSVVSYLIREQFYNKNATHAAVSKNAPGRLGASLIMLNLREWNLDVFMNKWVFHPIKRLGHQLDFLRFRNVVYYFLPLYVAGLIGLYYRKSIPDGWMHALPLLCSGLGFLMVLKSFSERHTPLLAWTLLIMNHFWMALAVSFNDHFDLSHTLTYLSGIVVMGGAGLYGLFRLRKAEPSHFSLNRYFGHVHEHPRFALLFLLACLGLMGFPISPTFIGEDLIFSHIQEHQFWLALFHSGGFIVGGISLVRIYARLFLGPHVKSYHPTAIQSS
ncbi:MAG: hypothetical protein RL160_98 [Bacteroidota bacterium]|jgi:NADH:ubiquinone oxidoreductase subunit 5 (subunit L)/multisubunit Na+/H+ antiporter MnhA subunit